MSQHQTVQHRPTDICDSLHHQMVLFPESSRNRPLLSPSEFLQEVNEFPILVLESRFPSTRMLPEEPKFGCAKGFARQPNLEWASEREQIMEGTITGGSDYRTVSIN